MMRGLTKLGLGAMIILILVLGPAGCSDDDCPECPDGTTPAPALDYVGSATCGTCHASNYEKFMQSGHPYKLSAVVDNTAPTYPFDGQQTATVANDGPPAGHSWSEFAYVIGGYGWKARWVKTDGNILTGPDVQLNLADGGYVAYHDGETKPYNYGCFKCHTTGASETGSWPSGSSGFGSFAFGGVQCEECHGKGSQHASDPTRFELTVNERADACGRCHHRDAENRVAVSINGTTREGFIRHHEQFDEFSHSPHASLDCVSCHDPHSSVVYDDLAAGDGVEVQCTSCHQGYDTNLTHVVQIDCVNCHMPDAAKSARADNKYHGDVASHLFKINTNPVGMTEMWTSDGSFVKLDEFGKGALTLDFACYGCHKDENGVGGTGSTKTLAELSTKAQGMHGTPKRALSQNLSTMLQTSTAGIHR